MIYKGGSIMIGAAKLKYTIPSSKIQGSLKPTKPSSVYDPSYQEPLRILNFLHGK